jgi:hypothetical protein
MVHTPTMKPRSVLFVLLAPLLFSGMLALAQDPPDKDKPVPAHPTRNRITIEVTGGDKNVAVQNASVYLKYVEEHTLRKDKKVELNVKTNGEGVAHVPDAPVGRALVQIIADGWKTYGRWYDISDPNQTIKVHLDRPPKWY